MLLMGHDMKMTLGIKLALAGGLMESLYCSGADDDGTWIETWACSPLLCDNDEEVMQTWVPNLRIHLSIN